MSQIKHQDVPNVTNRSFISGDLLERLCYATEFEIEGWKKIVPLTDILKQYTNVPFKNENPILKLKMEPPFQTENGTTNYAVAELNADEKFYDRVNNKFIEKFNNKTIRDSEIYRHFAIKKSVQKLVLYVSQQISINEKYLEMVNPPTGNHCVVATGIEFWNGIECLVLDNTGKNKEENYLPVDFPLFEDIWNKIKVNEKKNFNNSDNQKRFLNKEGFSLAQKKFQNLRDIKTATNFRRQNGDDWFNMTKDGEYEYRLFFVKGSIPIHKLEFHKS